MLTAIKNNGAILAIFACITTGLVAITHSLTEGRIAKQQAEQLLSVLNQVVPSSSHDNNLAEACFPISLPYLQGNESLHAYIATKQDKPVGIAIETIAPNGYNGAIKLIVGINNQGIVTGTRVLSQNETPGLGDKIDSRVTDWILGFTGKQLTQDNQTSWAVRKDGGQFDQFTGATITPRAVVKSVKNVLSYVNQNRTELYHQPIGCEEPSQ
jgi:Na+-translocating ferredoxin:NAD+ oxidoreductase subunit G